MEPASALSQRGHVPWQGFLLSVSLLTLWSPPTAAQLVLELMPSSNTTEGNDVLFLVHNQTGDLIGYSWYKGQAVEPKRLIVSYRIDTQNKATGPAYSGRETIYPNGSLLFRNVTVEDTGYYTLHTINEQLQGELVTALLSVYPELPKPTVTSNNSDPMEHKDPVVLTCEPEIQDVTYLWLINSQSVQNSTRLELSKDNRTLTLLNVTRNDAGPYECEIRNPVSASRSDPFCLNVVYAPTQGSSGLSAGAIAGIVIGVLAAIALIAALVYFLYIRKTGGASDQRDLTDHKPSASNHSQGHSDNSPNKIDEVAYSSLNFSGQESKKPTSASPSSPTTETVYSEVKKK